jgi:hypothetical protein
LERLQQGKSCDRPDRNPGSGAKPANSSRVYHEITLRLCALKKIFSLCRSYHWRSQPAKRKPNLFKCQRGREKASLGKIQVGT